MTKLSENTCEERNRDMTDIKQIYRNYLQLGNDQLLCSIYHDSPVSNVQFSFIQYSV